MEVNNLYNQDHRALHLVDRCTRWQATTEVPDKKEETLMSAIERIWIGIFGPPKELLGVMALKASEVAMLFAEYAGGLAGPKTEEVSMSSPPLSTA